MSIPADVLEKMRRSPLTNEYWSKRLNLHIDQVRSLRRGVTLGDGTHISHGGKRSHRKVKTFTLGGDPQRLASIRERFTGHLEIMPDSDCWIWKAATCSRGYGRIKVNGKLEGAHRVAYMLFKGDLTPENPIVMHTCDNPSCVNPAHLVAGTDSTNMQDYFDKKRGA